MNDDPETITPIAARMPSHGERRDQAPPTVLLVGELNPYGDGPDMALYHLPEGAAGDRLRRITQLHAFTYLGLWRANLCAGKWSAPRARERAHRLLSGPFHLSADSPEWRPWDTVVMLGRKVARSFAAVLRATAAVEPFNAAVFTVHGLPVTLVSLPHPSGLSRAWNDPDAPGSARATLRAHAPGVPWGEDPSL